MDKSPPPPEDPPPLSPSDLALAVALFRRVRHYERMGVRMIVVSLGDPLRLRPVGQAVDLDVNYATLTPT